MENVHRPPLSGAGRARLREARDADARERNRRARGRADDGDGSRIKIAPPRRPLSELVGVRACKKEGCNAPANEQYDRGPFAGLCEEHIEERRAELADVARERHQDPSRGTDWTRESVVEAILAWARAHGRFPRSSEWQRARNGEARPTYDGVMRLFAGWREALAAAGFPAGYVLDDVQVAPDGTITTGNGAGRLILPGDDAAVGEPEREPEPEPEEEPEPPPDVEVPPLADLARELEEARDAQEVASDRYYEALREFQDHPLILEIGNVHGWKRGES